MKLFVISHFTTIPVLFVSFETLISSSVNDFNYVLQLSTDELLASCMNVEVVYY